MAPEILEGMAAGSTGATDEDEQEREVTGCDPSVPRIDDEQELGSAIH